MSTAAISVGATLVHGTTACLSSERGDISPTGVLGAYDSDIRFISALMFFVDDKQAPLLASGRIGANNEEFALIGALDHYSNGRVIVRRLRSLRSGALHEEIEVHALQEPCSVTITLRIQADGASILALKSGDAPPSPKHWSTVRPTPTNSNTRSATNSATSASATCVWTSDAEVTTDETLTLRWTAEASPGNVWNASWSAQAATATARVLPHSMSSLAVAASDHRWTPAIRSAVIDLNSLVMPVDGPNGETLRTIGAGAPWYLAIFGRDSLLAAWETLPLGTELAIDVLRTLAAFQGTVHDEHRLEAPGRILHERRIGTPQVFGLRSGSSYFGTIDAAPLFVMLLTEAYRWGADRQGVEDLLPAARQAIAWCIDAATQAGPTGSSEFMWYRSDRAGLGNQGWKDSGDCMVHPDGTLATGPFALCEVQGYFHDALIGLARLEADLGDSAAVAKLIGRAQSLRDSFADTFVGADGLVALALDGDMKPLQVATSNMGQCLWTGILSPKLARSVADRVMAPDLLSHWGIRTLGNREVAYNPLGYHLGSIWAHDTALIAAGMARHGFSLYTQTLVDALLAAAEGSDWRLAELFGGLDTRTPEGAGRPVPYPAACSPQAWSAGAPLVLLRAMLGLEVDVPAGRIDIRPNLPTAESITVEGIRIGGRVVKIEAMGNTGTIACTG